MTDAREQAEQRPTAGKRVTKLRPGQRRLEWIADIIGAKKRRGVYKYSRLACDIARALAWKYSDKTTGETFASIELLALECDCEKRAVMNILAQLLRDRFLKKISKHSPGHPVKYRLTFPGESDDDSEMTDDTPF